MTKLRVSALTLSKLKKNQGVSVRESVREPQRVEGRTNQKRSCSLTLPYPPSANRYWRVYRNTVVKSEAATAYQREVRSLIVMDGQKPLKGDISVTMIVYRPRKQGDLDNRIKVLLDAMNGNIYEDDEQVAVIHAERRYDKDNPRVELFVEEI